MLALNPEIKTLIENYKLLIRKTRLQDEVYKWELVNKYKGRPDTGAIDFTTEIKSVKFGNLIYAMAGAVVNHLAKEQPEELRKLFSYLFDESKPLNNRVSFFNEESLKLYRSIGEKLGHHQDERSISTYLTFHNPEKYTFYKSTFYKDFCGLLQVIPAGKNEKYVHYLQLLNDFIEQYIVPDKELIELVKEYIPEYYNGSSHLLLAQDILYSMFQKFSEEINYWVFQGNPKIYDIKGSLNAGALKSWSVKSDKETIKSGDKIILWSTGDEAGIYALGEVTSEPTLLKEELVELKFYKVPSNNEEAMRVGISITHNLADQPLTKNQIKEIKELENLKVGSQGTNFQSNEKEYQTILKMIENNTLNKYNSELLNYLAQFDKKDLDIYFNFLIEILKKNNIQIGDQRVSFTFSNNRINFIVGQRYAWNLYNKDKRGKFGVLSKESLNDSSELFDGNIPRPYYTHFFEFNPSENEITTIDEGILMELERSDKSGFRSHNKNDFENFVFNRMKNTTMKLAKNIILYGPPGTGKTFTLKTKYFPLYTTKETSLTSQQHFENLVNDYTWWQVIALALLEHGTSAKVADIMSNRWVKRKADVSESKNVRATIWGTLQMHTIHDSTTVQYTQRQVPLIFDKKADKAWRIIETEVKESCPELYDTLNSVNNFNPNPEKEIKRYVFTTFHQSFNYEDFIEGIKPILTDEEGNGDVAYRIEDGIFKQLCKKAESDPENRYAIFIDEINRGNVSNIFGELITLIEQDKRKGADYAMSVVLPYSKKSFAVPSNVDIYGTMNTADRSVEALDTALRRRFSFEEMLPQPELIKTEGSLKETQGMVNEIDLALLLTTINKRIEKLLDKDHQIGHSYFLKVETLDNLKSAFYNSIIPLLQEYFFGDYGKIGLVLGQGFFEEMENSEDDKFFAEFKEYEIDGILEKQVYHIKNVNLIDNNSFIEIVKAILPRK